MTPSIMCLRTSICWTFRTHDPPVFKPGSKTTPDFKPDWRAWQAVTATDTKVMQTMQTDIIWSFDLTFIIIHYRVAQRAALTSYLSEAKWRSQKIICGLYRVFGGLHSSMLHFTHDWRPNSLSYPILILLLRHDTSAITTDCNRSPKLSPRLDLSGLWPGTETKREVWLLRTLIWYSAGK